MSVSVCRSSSAAAAAAAFEPKPAPEVDVHVNSDAVAESETAPGQFEIWTSIQAQKAASAQQQQRDGPYVPPLARRSSSLLSQASLETCTESLGSETGSDDFSSSDEETAAGAEFFPLLPGKENEADEGCGEDEEEGLKKSKKELVTVNYHCSISRRSALPRSFPPPLPSISRRDGPCFQMRPRRSDGRLVVEAVPVPSQNYLHAERLHGRLLLSFIDTFNSTSPCRGVNNIDGAIDMTEQNNEPEANQEAELADDDEDQDEAYADVEEEEEEVQVVDRGTVVEVKVSTQPQQSIGAANKVRRSSIVINKFVSCTPAVGGANTPQEMGPADQPAAARPSVSPARRLSTATTTAAAAAVAASSLSALSAADGSHSSTNDNKLLFTSRRSSREELMHDMSRCSQLRKPIFIREPFCIATSS